MKIIDINEKEYPKVLRKIENPPKKIYVEGDEKILNSNCIAVVGSRKNTKYGGKWCKKFVKELVKYDLKIVSGMALGIDWVAHKEAIKEGGKTIAVLPSGLKNIYPKENIKLYEEIISNGGCVISEYEPYEEAESKKFLERNRIVAGLSAGTLVIEAGYRSGTRVTARFTIENERPLFCVPSSLENIKGKTTNELIQQGAKLVTCVEDMFGDIYENNPESIFSKKEKEKNWLVNIPPDLISVFKEIDNVPRDINYISRKTKLPISEVNYKIMLLQLEGKIIEKPGHKFVRNEED